MQDLDDIAWYMGEQDASDYCLTWDEPSIDCFHELRGALAVKYRTEITEYYNSVILEGETYDGAGLAREDISVRHILED